MKQFFGSLSRQSIDIRNLNMNSEDQDDEKYNRFKTINQGKLKLEFENEKLVKHKSLSPLKQEEILAKSKLKNEIPTFEFKNLLDELCIENQQKRKIKQKLEQNLRQLVVLQDQDKSQSLKNSRSSSLMQSSINQSVFNVNDIGDLLNGSRNIKYQQFYCHQKYLREHKSIDQARQNTDELNNKMVSIKQSMERVQILFEKEQIIQATYQSDLSSLQSTLNKNQKKLSNIQQELDFFLNGFRNLEYITPQDQVQTDSQKVKEVYKEMMDIEQQNLEIKKVDYSTLKKEISKEEDKLLKIRFQTIMRSNYNDQLLNKIEEWDKKELIYKQREQQQILLCQYIKCFERIHLYFLDPSLKEKDILKQISKDNSNVKSISQNKRRKSLKKKKFQSNTVHFINKPIKKKDYSSKKEKRKARESLQFDSSNSSIFLKRCSILKKKCKTFSFFPSRKEEKINFENVKASELHKLTSSFVEIDSNYSSESEFNIDEFLIQMKGDPFNLSFLKNYIQNVSLDTIDDIQENPNNDKDKNSYHKINSHLKLQIDKFLELIQGDLETFQFNVVSFYNKLFIQNNSLNSFYELLYTDVHKKKFTILHLDKQIDNLKQENVKRIQAQHDTKDVIDHKYMSMDSGIIIFNKKDNNKLQKQRTLKKSSSNISSNNSDISLSVNDQQKQNFADQDEELKYKYLTTNEVNFQNKNDQNEISKLSDKNKTYEKLAFQLYTFLNEFSYRLCTTVKLLIINTGLVPQLVQIKLRNLSQVLGRKNIKLFIPSYKNEGDEMFKQNQLEENILQNIKFGFQPGFQNRNSITSIQNLKSLRNQSISSIYESMTVPTSPQKNQKSKMPQINTNNIDQQQDLVQNKKRIQFSPRNMINIYVNKEQDPQNDEQNPINDNKSNELIDTKVRISSRVMDEKPDELSVNNNQKLYPSRFSIVKSTRRGSRSSTPPSNQRYRNGLNITDNTQENSQNDSQLRLQTKGKFTRQNTRNKTVLTPKKPSESQPKLSEELRYEIDMPEWNQIISYQTLQDIARQHLTIPIDDCTIQFLYDLIKSDRFIGYFINQEKIIEFFNNVCKQINGIINKNKNYLRLSECCLNSKNLIDLEVGNNNSQSRIRSVSSQVQGEKLLNKQTVGTEKNIQEIDLTTVQTNLQANGKLNQKTQIKDAILDNFYSLKNFTHLECTSHIKMMYTSLKDLVLSLIMDSKQRKQPNGQILTPNYKKYMKNEQMLNGQRTEHAPLLNIHMNNKFIQNSMNTVSKKIYSYLNADEYSDNSNFDKLFFQKDKQDKNKKPDEYKEFIKNANTIHLSSKSKQVTSERIKLLLKKYFRAPQPLQRIQFIQKALMPFLKQQVNKMLESEQQIDEERNKLKEILNQQEKENSISDPNKNSTLSHHMSSTQLSKTKYSTSDITFAEDQNKKKFPTHLYLNPNQQRYASVKQLVKDSQVLRSIDKLDKIHPVDKKLDSSENSINQGKKQLQRIVQNKENKQEPYIPTSKQFKKQLTKISKDSGSSQSSLSSSDVDETPSESQIGQDNKNNDKNIQLGQLKNTHYFLKRKYKTIIKDSLLRPLYSNSMGTIQSTQHSQESRSPINNSFFKNLDPYTNSCYSSNYSQSLNKSNQPVKKDTIKIKKSENNLSKNLKSILDDSKVKMMTIYKKNSSSTQSQQLMQKKQQLQQQIHKNYSSFNSSLVQSMNKFFPSIDGKQKQQQQQLN